MFVDINPLLDKTVPSLDSCKVIYAVVGETSECSVNFNSEEIETIAIGAVATDGVYFDSTNKKIVYSPNKPDPVVIRYNDIFFDWCSLCKIL